jgi:hypothetical protein
MKRLAKTAADRRNEQDEAERRCWAEFRPRLAAVQTFVEARLLAAETPPVGSAGRRFYSNLSFFLMAFEPPAGASHEEKRLYLQLVRRFDAAGALNPGARERIERGLLDAMGAQESD